MEARSWEKSGSGLEDEGDREMGVELREWDGKESVLASDPGRGLADRWTRVCAWP